MSNNITISEYMSGMLFISESDNSYLSMEYEGRLPENCFLNHIKEAYPDFETKLIEITSFEWSQEGSGRSYESILIEDILPCTKGEAEILFVWEGGNSYSGLHVKDGIVTSKTVQFQLI